MEVEWSDMKRSVVLDRRRIPSCYFAGRDIVASDRQPSHGSANRTHTLFQRKTRGNISDTIFHETKRKIGRPQTNGVQTHT